jgi:hypothetical protein
MRGNIGLDWLGACDRSTCGIAVCDRIFGDGCKLIVSRRTYPGTIHRIDGSVSRDATPDDLIGYIDFYPIIN